MAYSEIEKDVALNGEYKAPETGRPLRGAGGFMPGMQRPIEYWQMGRIGSDAEVIIPANSS